jgi:5'-methylthioadenosine phosphorylase
LKKAEIGIIGGSGLYAMPGLTNVREERVTTPFGDPSDAFILGELEGRKVTFLARHGRGHRILPSELNFRANIFALKMLGVERILSVSAVGSLKEEHKPTDFVIPDQFIDRTFARVSTFFGDGIVAHVAFGDPVCATVASVFQKACDAVGVVGKTGGTYVCMEGPQFSTRAESNLYRSWPARLKFVTPRWRWSPTTTAGGKAMMMSLSIRWLRCCIRTPTTQLRLCALLSPQFRSKRVVPVAMH